MVFFISIAQQSALRLSDKLGDVHVAALLKQHKAWLADQVATATQTNYAHHCKRILLHAALRDWTLEEMYACSVKYVCMLHPTDGNYAKEISSSQLCSLASMRDRAAIRP